MGTIENYEYQYRRGVDNSLSVKKLGIEEYLYIIREYSKSFKAMESVFQYDGKDARVANISNLFGLSLGVLRDAPISLKQKYKDFVRLLNEADIVETINHRDTTFKGVRRRIFDILVKNRLIPISFLFVISYKGNIY